ncbi:unnamed protein product [Cuscuta europaea]|uniref:Uncharacterized protein n=1 Tax=Cuscuta europaea TaxID=41803 RepID=A0A9P1E885_CUSEU|nr:unnamed protein product [Cuscuta europaea]
MTTEESIEEDLSYEPSSEVDSVYEFDASRYFDFCLPESSSDTERAERWFHVAGYYPPSRHSAINYPSRFTQPSAPALLTTPSDTTPALWFPDSGACAHMTASEGQSNGGTASASYQ